MYVGPCLHIYTHQHSHPPGLRDPANLEESTLLLALRLDGEGHHILIIYGHPRGVCFLLFRVPVPKGTELHKHSHPSTRPTHINAFLLPHFESPSLDVLNNPQVTNKCFQCALSLWAKWTVAAEYHRLLYTTLFPTFRGD